MEYTEIFIFEGDWIKRREIPTRNLNNVSTTARRSPLFSWYGELSIFISQGKKISSEDEDAEFYRKSLKNVTEIDGEQFTANF